MRVSGNQFATFTFNGDFIHVRYNEGIILDCDIAKKMVDDLSNFQHDEVYPYLIDISGLYHFTQCAREYLSSARTRILTKAAFLCSNNRSRVMGEFYLRVNNPVGYSEIFSEEKDAILFLKR
jgi:hypothetical protein